MGRKWNWAVVLLMLAGGCEQYLDVAPHRLWVCPKVPESCICGDGIVSSERGEACDDGNTQGADGCSATCQREVVTSIVAGGFHSCVLLTGGAVKCWGDNRYGQLGIGDRDNRGDGPDEMGDHLPGVFLGNGRYATALATGAFHTCALLDDASVKCWGLNGIGQLGVGDTTNRGDDPNEMGDDLQTVDLGTGITVKGITAGAYHTCALSSDSRVTCWGANVHGQLGVGDHDARGRSSDPMVAAVDLGSSFTVETVVAGDSFTCALGAGAVKCWGMNRFGQLGQGDTLDRGDGTDEMGENLPAVMLGAGKAVQSLAVGNAHVCALFADGGMKCWGGNWDGQLGHGNVAPYGNAMGQMGDALPSTTLDAGTISRIVAGHSHNCLLAQGYVKCWGSNQVGQLGIGDQQNRGDDPWEVDTIITRAELGRTATMVAAGAAHTCALLKDGGVKCWGGNASGQLGIGDTSNRGDDSGELELLPSVKLFSDDGSGAP